MSNISFLKRKKRNRDKYFFLNKVSIFFLQISSFLNLFLKKYYKLNNDNQKDDVDATCTFVLHILTITPITIQMITIPIKETQTPVIIMISCVNPELLFSCTALPWDSVVCTGVDVVFGDVLAVVVGILDGAGVDVVSGDVLGVVEGTVGAAGVGVVSGNI